MSVFRGDRHLHPDSSERAAAWIRPLLHQLPHTTEHRVIHTLEELLAGNPADPILNRKVNHLQNHRDHLNYADLAARNAPIGSGSMESVCDQFQENERLNPAKVVSDIAASGKPAFHEPTADAIVAVFSNGDLYRIPRPEELN